MEEEERKGKGARGRDIEVKGEGKVFKVRHGIRGEDIKTGMIIN